MNQLKHDIAELKSMGFISIARQYSRMAKTLKSINKYAKLHEFDTFKPFLRHNLNMGEVKDMSTKALKRFEK